MPRIGPKRARTFAAAFRDAALATYALIVSCALTFAVAIGVSVVTKSPRTGLGWMAAFFVVFLVVMITQRILIARRKAMIIETVTFMQMHDHGLTEDQGRRMFQHLGAFDEWLQEHPNAFQGD
jgi:prolipoprotein diacylglyceryltransferase